MLRKRDGLTQGYGGKNFDPVDFTSSSYYYLKSKVSVMPTIERPGLV